MSVMVTGATGFLGGRYALSALARGEEVIALGRNREKLERLEAAGARIICGDLTKGVTRRNLLGMLRASEIEQIECIVHCAALSSPFGSRADFYFANVEATDAVCDLALMLPSARLIHISTPAIYAAARDQWNVTEDAVLPKPINHYAATKRRAELLVAQRMSDRAITLRPRGIYGRGDNALLPRLMRTAARGPLPLLRGGAARTDITHVEDVVRAIDAARSAPDAAWGAAYNISGGVALRITEVIETAARHEGIAIRWQKMPVPVLMAAARLMEAKAALGGWKKEPRATPYSVGILAFSQTLDISLAQRKLGWTPAISFEEGVAEAFSGRDPRALGR